VSLIVIFLPVAFMTGYSQRFIYPFGFTMAFAVMVSLLVSLTLTPMLSARVIRHRGPRPPPRRGLLRPGSTRSTAARSSGRWITAA
jgi:multidrug efflux pump subunit AcrB